MSDVRLLAFWYRQSLRVAAVRNLEMMYNVRAGMAVEEDFRQIRGVLEEHIATLSGKVLQGRDERIRQNWEDLKQIGRG